jgi:hypothetical protein
MKNVLRSVCSAIERKIPVIQLKRLFIAVCFGFVTFVVAFLAVFVPLFVRDIHYAPHDGQGGLGGFVLGIPVAAIAALISIPAGYGWMVNRRWFDVKADGSKPEN